MATTTLITGTRASRSTIALKLLMAASGIIFLLFVLVHMYGNLKAFAGHDAYDEYAEHIRTVGTPMLPYAGALWVIRVVLIVSLIAPPVDYAYELGSVEYTLNVMAVS